MPVLKLRFRSAVSAAIWAFPMVVFVLIAFMFGLTICWFPSLFERFDEGVIRFIEWYAEERK